MTYDDNYYPEDDMMPFGGWATIDISWSNLKRCRARIQVRGDWDGDGLTGIEVTDLDWLEIETVDGFRKGQVEAFDADDPEADELVALFSNLPAEAMAEALSGTTLSDIDDREIELP